VQGQFGELMMRAAFWAAREAAGVQPSVGIRNTASPIEVEEEEGGPAMT